MNVLISYIFAVNQGNEGPSPRHAAYRKAFESFGTFARNSAGTSNSEELE